MKVLKTKKQYSKYEFLYLLSYYQIGTCLTVQYHTIVKIHEDEMRNELMS